MTLMAWELEVAEPVDREQAARRLVGVSTHPLLVLNTCQRFECFGFSRPEMDGIAVGRTWSDMLAFERLARIAAGLESRILGELEVLGNVRNAYKTFRSRAGAPDRELDRIFQDALALGRKARRMSGVDRNLTSLGALAVRELLSRISGNSPVAVIGSGSLAGSVVRHLGKLYPSPIRVAARCRENATQLADRVGGFAMGLDDLAHLLDGVGGIISATAAPYPVLHAQHLERALRPLVVVDLGVPPDSSPEVAQMPGVEYIALETVEAKARINTDERHEQASVAARIIQEGALKWARQS